MTVKTVLELQSMKISVQSVASSIIEAQEALEYLREETELTLQSAGNTCLALEKIIDELKQSKGITHELSS